MTPHTLHLHWRVVAWNGASVADFAGTNSRDAVRVTMIGCTTEDSALQEARVLVTREHYAITDIWECNQCQFQTRMVDTMKELASSNG